jgi:transglutaminase-like putative cysteine protease
LKILRIVIASALFIFLGGPFLGNEIKADVHPEKSFKASGEGEGKTSESWMGIYMNGIKIGYSHSQELALTKNGMTYRKEINETRMKVSRLGGNPVEMVSVQESLYDKRGKPLECILRMKMSESETVLKAEIAEDKILFKSEDKLIKELPYEEEFYLETPLEKIIAENGLKPGQKLNFKILNPLSYSLADCRFEVIGREEVLILGNKMNLWHIKEEMVAVIPVIMDEWIDGSGECWKTVSQASLITSTSIRMPKEKALEVSGENFDIAFSTLIRPNMTLESPREVQKATFRLSGVAPDKIKNFPFDDGSQKILEAGKDYVVIETSSQVFREEEALGLPVKDEQLRRFLKPTSFCQADDPEIQEAAKRIVGSERNSWRAAKKIAEWVKEEMTPNYDVGFATAKEVLRNRKGDCSEHTVIAVALFRAAGIPARAAVGIMYAQGIFAYHMWPEVYVGRWIGLDAKWLAVDKKSGEYYTDATHLKFGRSLLDENIFKEMAQAISEIVGQLRLEIVDYSQDK